MLNNVIAYVPLNYIVISFNEMPKCGILVHNKYNFTLLYVDYFIVIGNIYIDGNMYYLCFMYCLLSEPLIDK